MDSSWTVAFIFLLASSFVNGEDQTKDADIQRDDSKQDPKKLYTLEGAVDIEGVDISLWGPKTRVLVDSGKYIGYLKVSGEFQIVNVPSGSYTIEVVTSNHVFDPIRVDISGKTGKIRARKLNLLKPNAVSSLPYPLRFQTSRQAEFFQKRETWSLLSMLKNPMVRSCRYIEGCLSHEQLKPVNTHPLPLPLPHKEFNAEHHF